MKPTNANIIDAAAHGASDGLRIGMNVVAMLIAFIALIALGDSIVGFCGQQLFAHGLRGDALGL